MPVAPVNLRGERLVFTQSDANEGNFGVDTEGRTCLFDFTEVGLLPESFASYTMSFKTPFIAAVAKHLGWPTTSNLDAMCKINRVVRMLADPTLGTFDSCI